VQNLSLLAKAIFFLGADTEMQDQIKKNLSVGHISYDVELSVSSFFFCHNYIIEVLI
jgi:hypothetical protein